MKTEIAKIVKEISAWCIDNHSKEFMCDFQFTAHVDWVEVKLMSGGYNSGGEVFDGGHVSIDNKDWSFKWLVELFKEMKEFKAWHDKEFAPENLAKKQKLRKQARAKSLKKELDKLEAELHDPKDILATLNTPVNE